jgi:4-hydroxybutyryl-CoA dehydratase/vinylacetyl-CoA-Delta-isomerase
MTLKTKEQYVESIRRMNPEAYMRGKRISDLTRNGFTRLALQGIGQIYELSRDGKHADLLTRTRDDGAQISAYCSIHRSKEDLVNRVRAARLIC